MARRLAIVAVSAVVVFYSVLILRLVVGSDNFAGFFRAAVATFQ